jgi:predicted lipid-binding transport protein (Tim44 family)
MRRRDMANPNSRFPRAGGALLAGSILGGVLIGAFAGETSIGFLAGLAVGLVLLAAVWLRERR